MTKDKITIAALRLFLLRGYKNVSLVDVAQEVGITKGGIYHYFASKEELLNQAIEFLFGLIEAKYEKLFSNGASLQEVLTAIIVGRELEKYTNTLLGICQGDYRINYASFALEVMYNFPELKERLDDSHLQLCKVIQKRLEAAAQAGEVRCDVDIATLAAIILSIFHGQNSLGLPLSTLPMRQQMMDNIWKLIAG
ncbi:MAG: TetR/AcrR family transcriptional regulator [Pelosinus sp.]|nr:TetR/AcrR family transcriptional regulator [Pelosinus sp.]